MATDSCAPRSPGEGNLLDSMSRFNKYYSACEEYEEEYNCVCVCVCVCVLLIQPSFFFAAPPNLNRARRTRFRVVSGVRIEAQLTPNKEVAFVGPLTKRTLSGHSAPVRPGCFRAHWITLSSSCTTTPSHV